MAVLAADGFEQLELTGPMRTLARHGADVRVISLRPGRIRGMYLLWRGRKVAVDDTVFEACSADFGALFLPGGFINPDVLRQSERALEFVRAIDGGGRPVAVICHGPEVLISAGLVRGRRLTSWPAIADDVRTAGGHWEDAPVVRDGNWVSSRGPHDLRAFEKAMVELFDELAPRGAALPRRLSKWIAHLTRAATVAGGFALAGMALARRRSAARARPGRGDVLARAVHVLVPAAAFGGVLFGKIALDLAARAPGRRNDRARIHRAVACFLLPSGISFTLAIATWIAAGRRRAMGEAAADRSRCARPAGTHGSRPT